ncbi:hypothetical protein [Paenibacillus rigui]|uniref:DUF1189 domain-containing protein n=1 Tax=Paenibacillus rigui TaxID=554312 RepID=A0A229UQW2_9BACL|nr:hypothetical protein [Paenibacillus rigui]OXM85798.1 hypothetical protein CF651_11205 [Paenibacillus rigui]
MNTLYQLFFLVKSNPIGSAILTFILTFMIWLYKENKAIIQNENKINFDSNRKTAAHYGQLESVISLNIVTPSEKNEQKLFDALGNCSPYYTDDLRKVIRDYYSDHNSNKLQVINSLVQVEIDKLNREATKYIIEYKTKDFSDFLIKLFRPAIPIFYMVVCSIIVSMYFIMWESEASSFRRLNIIFSGLSLIFGGPLFIWLIHDLFEKIFRIRTFIFYGSLLFIILMPIISMIFVSFGIIGFGLQLIAVVFLFVYLKKIKVISRI